MSSENRSDLKPLVLSVVVGLFFGLLIALFTSKIGELGFRIPSTHLIRDYFVALLWCLIIACYLVCIPVSFEERRDLLILWGARCAVTLGAMLFYECNYPLDAYFYYDVSLQPGFDWNEVGYGFGTINVQALTWTLNHYLPMLDSYHALKVAYSFIGYMASYIIYRTFAPFCGRAQRSLLYLVFLFPSMIFWSSILGKDPVILLGISIYVYGTVRFIYRGNPLYVLLIAMGIAIAATFRSWYLAILVVPLGSLALSGIKHPLLKLLFLGVIAGGTAYAAQLFSSQFQVASMGDLVGRTQTISHSWNHGGSALDAPAFSGIGGMLRFAPVGMFTALFRPLPGEVMNPFGMMTGIENCFIFYIIYKAYKSVRRDRSRLREPLTIWAISLILVWSFIYGFVSFQNLGAAIRFRLQILPVMLCLLFFLISGGEARNVRDRRLA